VVYPAQELVFQLQFYCGQLPLNTTQDVHGRQFRVISPAKQNPLFILKRPNMRGMSMAMDDSF
jgi:hypothetical protein